MKYRNGIFLLVFCISLIFVAPIPAQDGVAAEGEPAHPAEVLAVLAVFWGIVCGIPVLCEKILERPLPPLTPGDGGEEQNRLALEKLEVIKQFKTHIDDDEVRYILFTKHWQARKTRKLLKTVASLEPGDEKIVESANDAIAEYNALTRRRFSGSWSVVCAALVVGALGGWGLTPVFFVHMAFAAIAYALATRGPIYHLVQNKFRFGREIRSAFQGVIKHQVENPFEVTGHTEWRNAATGALVRKETHHAGDGLISSAILYCFVFLFVGAYIVPLALFNLFRNYVIHWYT